MRTLLKRLWLFFAISLMIFASGLVVARLTVPRLLPERQQLQQMVQQMIAHPVRIGHAELLWQGFGPVLQLDDVELLTDDKTKVALSIGAISLKIGLVSSALQRRWVVAQVIIDKLQLDIVQLAEKQFTINTLFQLDLSAAQAKTPSSGMQLVWLLGQRSLHLQHLQVRWHMVDGTVAELQDLSIHLSNHGAQHRAWGYFEFLPALAPVKFSIDLMGDGITDTLRSVRLYLTLKHLQIPTWVRHYQPLTRQLTQGKLDLQLWAKWEAGQWQSIHSNLDLTGANIHFVATNDDLAIDVLRGDLLWQAKGKNTWQLNAKDFMLKFAGVEAWPADTWRISARNAQQSTIYQATLNYLRLEDLQPLLLHHVLPRTWQTHYEAWQPHGQLRNIKLIWQAHTPIAMHANFEQIGFKARGHIPGMAGMYGAIHYEKNNGYAMFNGQDPSLYFNELFPGQLNLKTLQAKMIWEKQGERWNIRVLGLKLADHILALEGELGLQLSASGIPPAELDAKLTLDLPQPRDALRYLPVTLMSPHLVLWLDKALVSGGPVHATALLHGPLARFPFLEGEGEFKVAASLNDVTLQFHPNWPALESLNGRLLVDKQTMRIVADNASLGGQAVNTLEATIPNLMANRDIKVLVDGDLHGTLEEAKQIIVQSALANTLGKRLQPLTISGPIELHLSLDVPLALAGGETHVNGQLRLLDNALSLSHKAIDLTAVQGLLVFDEDALSSDGLSGKLFDKAFVMRINTHAKGTDNSYTRFSLYGAMDIDTLAQQLQTSYLQYLRGEAAYKVFFDLPKRLEAKQRVLIQSDLKGIVIELPGLYVKAADQSLPFSLALELGSEAGDIGINEFTVDAASSHTQGNKRLDGWSIAEHSDNLVGNIELPPAGSKKPIVARFEKLVFSPAEDEDKTESKLTAHSLPALDFTCQALTYAGRYFGQVSLELEPMPWGTSIRQLQAKTSAWQLDASGEWKENNKQQQTSHLQGKLVSRQLATTLKDWNLPVVIDAKQASIDFNMDWSAGLQDFSLSKAQGNFGMRLKNGKIPNLSASAKNQIGLGKILNILSLPSLSRRLSLDFSDISSNDFTFDILEGKFTLEKGNARTTDLYLDGSIAHVAMQGRLGLKAKDIDAKITITPYVTESLPVMAALFAGAPIVGMAAWVANKMTAPALNRLVRHHYQMTGSWQAPKVDEITTDKKG